MKNAVMTAALLFAALGARAEMPQMLGTDPLSRQILIKTAQKNGGVTAAVRVGTGQSVELKFDDAESTLSAGRPIHPAPAPAPAPKASKVKTKKARSSPGPRRPASRPAAN
jgi:hypothetical protein